MRKLSIVLAVLTLSSAASAFAEAPYPVDRPFVSSVSRAEVKQELIQAEQQGLLSQGDNYPAVPKASSLSRREVRQEMQTAHNTQGDMTYAGA